MSYILGKMYLELGITKEQRDINNRLKIYKSWALKFVTKRVEKISNELKLQ